MINYELLVKQGEWELITQLPDDGSVVRCRFSGALKDDEYEYIHREELRTVKRKWFGTKVIVEDYLYKRIYQKSKEYSYQYMDDMEKMYFKKILTDKGFFVCEMGLWGDSLSVYWNKEQYDSVMK